jgi:hypothetical protein
MDLGTVKKRIENTYYTDAKECIEDIELVFNNCYTYNRDGEVISEEHFWWREVASVRVTCFRFDVITVNVSGNN